MFWEDSTNINNQDTNIQSFYNLYIDWKLEYMQNFNQEEDIMRFEVFRQNLYFIKQFNKNDNNTFKLGLNKFTAITNQEFQQTYLQQNYQSFFQQELQMQENNIINIKYKNQQINDKQQYKQHLPKYVNWSEKGYVNPIQDQGVCGSSWAFAAVSQLESLYAIKNQNLIKFSEQQLISCAPLPNLGCLGGNQLQAFEYTKKHGIMLELDYPYAQKLNFSPEECKYDQQKIVFKNSGKNVIEKNSPHLMKQQLQHQTLSVQISANSLEFQLYKSGIFNLKNCDSKANHYLSLIGYNDENNQQGSYWILKNSNGPNWGMNGYIYIAQEEGQGICGMNIQPSYPLL